MGMWSATSTTAGNAIQRERRHGTLEFTHSIQAAREVGADLLVASVYLAAGYALLRFFEVQGRRHATLERS